MTRDAMTQPAVTASVSSYKSLRKTIKRPSGKITCNICSKISTKFIWSRKNNKYIECSTCKQCWIKSRKKAYQSHQNYADKSNALLVGGLDTQSLIAFAADVVEKICSTGKTRKRKRRYIDRKTIKIIYLTTSSKLKLRFTSLKSKSLRKTIGCRVYLD